MSEDKKVVKVSITEKITYLSEVEMTKSEYKDWCNRIDTAKGWDKEEVGNDLMEVLGLSRVMDGDVSDTQVDDFFCSEFEVDE